MPTHTYLWLFGRLFLFYRCSWYCILFCTWSCCWRWLRLHVFYSLSCYYWSFKMFKYLAFIIIITFSINLRIRGLLLKYVEIGEYIKRRVFNPNLTSNFISLEIQIIKPDAQSQIIHKYANNVCSHSKIINAFNQERFSLWSQRYW